MMELTAAGVLKDANGGIVGIDDTLAVFGGYDQQYHEAGIESRPEWMEPEYWKDLPREEKIALANAMIARWQRYKDVVLNETSAG